MVAKRAPYLVSGTAAFIGLIAVYIEQTTPITSNLGTAKGSRASFISVLEIASIFLAVFGLYVAIKSKGRVQMLLSGIILLIILLVAAFYRLTYVAPF